MTTENVFIGTRGLTGEESLLMGLLDKLLGTQSRKPKPVITDPVALARIEQTQAELAARLDVLDERVQTVESIISTKEINKDA